MQTLALPKPVYPLNSPSGTFSSADLIKNKKDLVWYPFLNVVVDSQNVNEESVSFASLFS